MNSLEKNLELLECARYGEDEDLRLLLIDGADVNYMDISGSTALHKAAANNEVNCLKVLYEFNAKYIPNYEGNTPAHWAAQNGKLDALKFLLENYKEVDVLQQNNAQRSILTEAFQSSNSDCIALCLNHESAPEERLINLTNKKETIDKTNNDNNINNESSMNIEDDNTNVDNTSNDTNEVMHTMIFDNNITIKIRELPITNADNPFGTETAPENDTTGLSVWPASIILSHWIIQLAQNSPSYDMNSSNNNSNTTTTTTCSIIDNQPKVILELGAGCGLPAIVAAYCFTPDITYITDIHEPTLQNAIYNAKINSIDELMMNSITNENIKHNNYEEFIIKKNNNMNNIKDIDTKQSLLKILRMDWNDINTYPKEKVDLLLGSDLVYDINILTILIPTICNILNYHGSFLYCAPDTGRQGMEQLIYTLKQVNILCIERLPATSDMYRNILHGHDDNDDAFILNFYDLSSKQPHTLYHFKWDMEYITTILNTEEMHIS